MEKDSCRELINDGFRANICARKAKGISEVDGRPLCGIHLRSERIRRESEERYQREWGDRDRLRSVVKKIGKDLELEFGVQRQGESLLVTMSEEIFLKLIGMVQK